MQIQNKNPWPWPDSLDAMIAVPQHHKLLFENEFIRVLDTKIAPGEITAVHTHRFPSSLYFISWSDFVRYDADGNVLVDSRTFAQKPAPASALWGPALAPHSLKNIGENDLHVISVEIKKCFQRKIRIGNKCLFTTKIKTKWKYIITHT